MRVAGLAQHLQRRTGELDLGVFDLQRLRQSIEARDVTLVLRHRFDVGVGNPLRYAKLGAYRRIVVGARDGVVDGAAQPL